MDGVICDFEKRYRELFGEEPGDTRQRKEFTDSWTKFVEGGNFATLDYWPTAKEFLKYIETLEDKVDIEILSSSGGKKYHDLVLQQKIRWLCEHGIKYKANIVAGSRLKADYADGNNTILIDDTDYVIEGFIKKGGIGIWHVDLNNTIKLIEDALTE